MYKKIPHHLSFHEKFVKLHSDLSVAEQNLLQNNRRLDEFFVKIVIQKKKNNQFVEFSVKMTIEIQRKYCYLTIFFSWK